MEVLGKCNKCVGVPPPPPTPTLLTGAPPPPTKNGAQL
jgi:hypothetical protein